jgi:dihydroneopterin aldolase/D-erythro-7,8-dihydroneopterin triphosphate epimerase
VTRIHIRDLALRCIIGIFPEEREKVQDVMINVTMECDIPNAGRSDRIEDTVDYKAINKNIIRMVEDSEFNLIETMAETIADICLERDRVREVRVVVDKPGALRFARSVAVEVHRKKTQ